MRRLLILGLLVLLAATAACSSKRGGDEAGARELFAQSGAQSYNINLYNDVNCFAFPPRPGRLCAAWRLEIRSDRRMVWSVEITDVGQKSKVFADTIILSPRARRDWIAALKTGLEWSRTAAKEQVNIVKEIGVMEGGARAVFVSENRGGICAVHFSRDGWTPMGAVYMKVPDSEGPLSGQSIETLLKRLNQADDEIDSRQDGKRPRKAIFE